ncbi:MAG TPA: hypothetical protein VGW10_13560 [Solirubrobacteraceae bacterium]|nr:hypothetical protein [Solirubrobacteraceae bacterium]
MRYDSAESDRATAVEALTARVEGGRVALRPRSRDPLPDVTYGRRVRGSDGRTWLQYWFLYGTNEQDRGIVRTGRHEGDWEMVQLRLGRGGRPDAATFAQHSWAERCAWRGTVFVANDSHASYFTPGEHGRPWPDPDDFADGRGRAVRPEVRPFGAWVRWPGRWGRAEASWVPGEQSSPRGPAFQDDGAWRDPAAFHARARACGSGAPPHPLGVRVGGWLAVIGIAAGIFMAIRTRVRRDA